MCVSGLKRRIPFVIIRHGTGTLAKPVKMRHNVIHDTKIISKEMST